MEFPTPYEEMLRRHPQEVAQVVSHLRASRSKNRMARPEEMTWSYTTAISVMWPDDPRSLDERLSVRVRGRAHRWSGFSEEELRPFPPEVLEFYLRYEARVRELGGGQ